MLAYITIGTNHFQRSVNFYDAVFNVLGYSRLPAWTEGWAMWGDENNPGEGFSFCLCPPFDHPDGHKLACVYQHYSSEANKFVDKE